MDTFARKENRLAAKLPHDHQDRETKHPPSLHRCLGPTNLIENPQSGVRMRTRRVCRWRDAAMMQRWVAASFLATEKNFRRIMGWKDFWQLKAILGRQTSATKLEVA